MVAYVIIGLYEMILLLQFVQFCNNLQTYLFDQRIHTLSKYSTFRIPQKIQIFIMMLEKTFCIEIQPY